MIQLATDLNNYNIDVAAISDTHFKSKHANSIVSIPGYTLLRRDRIKRKEGGVTMYIKESRCLTAWNHSANDLTYELM